MRRLKEEQISTLVTDELFCNKCGVKIEKNSFGYFAEHLSVEKQWGFESRMDGEKHSFDICESCYTEFTNSFIFSAKKTD